MSISTLFNISLAFVCISASVYLLVLAYVRLQNYRAAKNTNNELFARVLKLSGENLKPKEADGGEWK